MSKKIIFYIFILTFLNQNILFALSTNYFLGVGLGSGTSVVKLDIDIPNTNINRDLSFPEDGFLGFIQTGVLLNKNHKFTLRYSAYASDLLAVHKSLDIKYDYLFRTYSNFQPFLGLGLVLNNKTSDISDYGLSFLKKSEKVKIAGGTSVLADFGFDFYLSPSWFTSLAYEYGMTVTNASDEMFDIATNQNNISYKFLISISYVFGKNSIQKNNYDPDDIIQDR